MTESIFSKKITWFSFVFSLLVIWVHSYNAELYLGGTQWAEPVGHLEYAIIDWVAQIAVPGFFMISGYLFYRNFDMSRLQSKWESRIQSVLVPYIVWNFLYYIGYVVSSRLPWIEEVVGKGKIPFRLDAAVDAV
ncbi:MAG: acyltransferase family protein, partial [Brotaphodocola sp.]